MVRAGAAGPDPFTFGKGTAHYRLSLLEPAGRSMTFDPEKAIRNPSAFYSDPQQVLDDERLTSDQKYRVLKTMEADAIELMTATAENMAGGEQLDLEAVRAALRSLEHSS